MGNLKKNLHENGVVLTKESKSRLIVAELPDVPYTKNHAVVHPGEIRGRIHKVRKFVGAAPKVTYTKKKLVGGLGKDTSKIGFGRYRRYRGQKKQIKNVGCRPAYALQRNNKLLAIPEKIHFEIGLILTGNTGGFH